MPHLSSAEGFCMDARGLLELERSFLRNAQPHAPPGLGLGRDPVRTPIPRSSAENGNFTDGEPWLPVESGISGLNIAAQLQDPTSLLSFYRALLRLRRAEPALSAGEVAIVEASDTVLAYERNHDGHRLLVALNFRNDAATIQVGQANQILLSSDSNRARMPFQGPSLELHRNEGVVVELA
jgi:alpha-glucosidase